MLASPLFERATPTRNVSFGGKGSDVKQVQLESPNVASSNASLNEIINKENVKAQLEEARRKVAELEFFFKAQIDVPVPAEKVKSKGQSLKSNENAKAKERPRQRHKPEIKVDDLVARSSPLEQMIAAAEAKPEALEEALGQKAGKELAEMQQIRFQKKQQSEVEKSSVQSSDGQFTIRSSEEDNCAVVQESKSKKKAIE